jgi:uncharacterized phage infection (PIP) family protein YhgE
MEDIAGATDDQAVRTEEVASMIDTATERSKQVHEEVETAAEANAEQIDLVEDIVTALDQLESAVGELDSHSNDAADARAEPDGQRA